MENLTDKIKGGLYGLLIGDAVGVPYEFHLKQDLPPYHQLDLYPPENFSRSYPHIAPGTWSDDGAQALCLLQSLLSCHSLNLEDCMQRFVSWYENGYMAIDNEVFDVGIQTLDAIHKFMMGMPVMKVADHREHANGNGALMRSLPLALWHKGSDHQLIEDAYLQSHLTHAHIRSKVCCALYCLWARYILKGQGIDDAWQTSVQILRQYYHSCPLDSEQLEIYIRPDERIMGQGTGYVVDCLHSARFALQRKTYQDVIRTAVALGNDTDTTACVAGGLAGLHFGYHQLPLDWVTELKGKSLVRPLIQQLLEHCQCISSEAS